MNNFEFSQEAWNYNCKRLTNQIFKLLPMFENAEDWQKQLLTIENELLGYNKIFYDNPGFMILISKLKSLEDCEDQIVFRKTVFQAITELKNITI